MAVPEEQMEILGYNQEVEEEVLREEKHRNPQNKYHAEILEDAQEEALEDILVAHMLVEAYSLQVDLDILLVDSLLVGILLVDILHVDLDTLHDLDILLVEVNRQAADDDIRQEELADPFVTSAALEELP